MLRRTIFCAVALFSASPCAAQPLAPPFATRSADPKAAARACPPAPAPVLGFALASKYGQAGPRRDREDDEAEAAFDKAMQPIRDFARDVVKSANDYHRTGRASAAGCVLDHLAAWARADALDGPETHTSWFKLATTISGLSLAYLQVRPALAGRNADAQAVESWLGRRGRDVAHYFETLKTPRSSRNNHRAWAGLAAATAGVASGDRDLMRKGFESFRTVACQATPEGALPLEIERGRKAAEYHLYALAALVTLAEIGERNGAPLYADCGGALARTVRFTLAALQDPARIAALAGAGQEAAGRVATASRLVFLEPWLVRQPKAIEAAAPWLGKRPLGLTDLGGNQTLLYSGR